MEEYVFQNTQKSKGVLYPKLLEGSNPNAFNDDYFGLNNLLSIQMIGLIETWILLFLTIFLPALVYLFS